MIHLIKEACGLVVLCAVMFMSSTPTYPRDLYIHAFYHLNLPLSEAAGYMDHSVYEPNQ